MAVNDSASIQTSLKFDPQSSSCFAFLIKSLSNEFHSGIVRYIRAIVIAVNAVVRCKSVHVLGQARVWEFWAEKPHQLLTELERLTTQQGIPLAKEIPQPIHKINELIKYIRC